MATIKQLLDALDNVTDAWWTAFNAKQFSRNLNPLVRAQYRLRRRIIDRFERHERRIVELETLLYGPQREQAEQ